MSEVENDGLTTAKENLETSGIPNLHSHCYPVGGTLFEILGKYVGRDVIIQFLIGADTFITKFGMLYDIGADHITLFNAADGSYTVGDFHAVKFATLLDPKKRSTRRK